MAFLKVVTNLRVPERAVNFFDQPVDYQHVKKGSMEWLLWCGLTEPLGIAAANGHVILVPSDRVMNMEHR